MNHAEIRHALGSYVLGALAPDERMAIDEHLLTCPECRDEVADLAPIPGLLSRIPLEEAWDASLLGDLPDPEHAVQRILVRVENERDRTERRARRWRTAAAGLAVAAAVALGFVVMTPEPGPREDRAPMVASAGQTASGTVALQARPWGTSVHLELTALPGPGAPYTAWALAPDGKRTPIASWGATETGVADVTGATALVSSALRDIVVTDAEGRALITWSRSTSGNGTAT